ncbi:MAG TPA: DUF4321 domain-containing protein [bacterium]|uniref:DUF4321 domain-containing protein n=1 Tax=candidate division TA06 bacterium ADurb.Bin417 TaxID=1852828 RepID=A0A1V5MKD2_UNCT6|nr:MAG: hypothetical protein BWY73_00184 [candidate division TA06 bacterium ADurb.Bin417]HNQ35007.1 DUF4321 domain-containing protein [bacterium]HNS48552.1 DUF4321 domain-containing protein [bacterium]
MKHGLGFFLLLLLISALIGSAVGEIAGFLLGPESPAYQFFTSAATPALNPSELDLILVKLTFGAALHLNLTALLGMIIATIAYLRLP